MEHLHEVKLGFATHSQDDVGNFQKYQDSYKAYSKTVLDLVSQWLEERKKATIYQFGTNDPVPSTILDGLLNRLEWILGQLFTQNSGRLRLSTASPLLCTPFVLDMHEMFKYYERLWAYVSFIVFLFFIVFGNEINKPVY
jgi:hypothetical protein